MTTPSEEVPRSPKPLAEAATQPTVSGGSVVSGDRARRAALGVLRELRGDTTWDRVWRHVDLPEGSLDRRFAIELSGGCVRLRSRLDWVLEPHIKRGLESLEDDVLDILRLGAFQILEERVADHAAVHATVELAKHIRPAASGLVNAVLRNLLRQGVRPFPTLVDDPLQHLVVAQSHPEWMVRRWLDRFGSAEAAALCAYNNQRPGFRLRVNRLRGSRDDILAELPGSQAGSWSPWSVRAESSSWSEIAPLLHAGRISVQDESGVVVGDLCAAQPGEFWMDMAAAPGGKSGALAEAVGESGRVIASDVSAEKLTRLRETAARLGMAHIEVQCGDARKAGGQSADGVLLDAPCSGLGVLSRRPDARWRKQPADIIRLSKLQSQLLEAVSANVRPGGTLVYSVCSFEPEETQDVVRRFEAKHPEFSLEQADVDAALQKQPGVLYCLPQEHAMDGGFAARWRRRSS